MSNKNYNKMSQKPAKEVETVVETAEVTEAPKPVELPTVFVPVWGIVTDCAKLNVRAKPNLNADVVYVVEKGVKVCINKKKSTKEFYCVSSADGQDTIGFCMKKYITVEQ